MTTKVQFTFEERRVVGVLVPGKEGAPDRVVFKTTKSERESLGLGKLAGLNHSYLQNDGKIIKEWDTK